MELPPPMRGNVVSRRAGSQVVTITTLGQRGPSQPRRRISVGGALVAGLAVLFLYGIVSLILHVVAATVLWIPSILAAGYVTTYARRRGILGWPRLALGVVVLVGVHIGLVAALNAL